MSVEYRPGRVTRLTFDRPEKRNAIDARCWELLDAGLQAFEKDDAARVLVLTGAGEHFSAGADLRGGITGSPETVAGTMRDIAGVVLRLYEMPKPTLARVDGVAVGAGMSLALACDVVVASDRARFGAVFTRLGLVPDCGLSWLLPRLVGPHRAAELCLSGRLVPAPEAQRLGLIGTVVPAWRLDATADEWAGILADCPPAAAAGTLRLLAQAWQHTFAEALEAEAVAQQDAVAARRGGA